MDIEIPVMDEEPPHFKKSNQQFYPQNRGLHKLLKKGGHRKNDLSE